MRSALVSMGLALILLVGAAFKCGSDNRRTGGNGPTTDGGPRPTTTSDGLKLGEYACYGAGGQLLIGLGFKVQAGNRYTDLDGGNSGTFSINDDTVRFHGGHLDGQVGKNLRDYKFQINQIDCGPF